MALRAAQASYLMAGLSSDELPDERGPAEFLEQALIQGRGVLSLELESLWTVELEREWIRAGERQRSMELVEESLLRFEHVAGALPWHLELRADLERRQGQFEQALATLEEARARAIAESGQVRQVDDLHDYLHLGEAGVYMQVGLLHAARSAWRRAQGRAAEQRDPRLELALHQMDAALALAAGDHGRVSSITAAAGDDDRLRLDACIAAAERRLERARQSAERPHTEDLRADLAKAMGAPGLAPHDQLEARRTLAELAFVHGDFEQARELLREVRAVVEGDAAFPREHAHLAEFDTRLLLAGDGPLPRDELSAARDRLTAAWTDMLAAWERVPRSAGGVPFLHYEERRSLFSTLVLAELALEPRAGALRAFELLLEAERRGSLVHALDASQGPAVTLDDVRAQLLAPNRGLLVFLPAATESLALTLDAQGAAVTRLGSKDRWERVRAGLVTAVGDDSSQLEECNELAAELASLLLGPELEARISSWDELTVVGLESLGWAPLELLPLAGRAGGLLGHELALGYVPSLTVGVRLAERSSLRPHPPAQEGLLAVLVAAVEARSAPDRDLAALPWSDALARRLLAPWPSERWLLETADAGALTALETAAASGARMLEVFCHGLVDHQSERPVALALGPSGESLDWDAIAKLRVPPLVTLAVCRAGRGRVVIGDEGASNLGGAFLVAGADAVLVSAEDLSFQGTAALLERVHEELAGGASAARALMLARRTLAGEGPWTHPFHHARLVAMGLPHAALPGLSTGRASAPGAEDGAAGSQLDLARRWPLLGLGTVLALVAWALVRRSNRAAA